jgi:hypothetical protein
MHLLCAICKKVLNAEKKKEKHRRKKKKRKEGKDQKKSLYSTQKTDSDLRAVILNMN